MSSRRLPAGVLVSIAITVLLAIFGYLVIHQADHSRQAIPILGQVPPFQFIQSNGAPFGRSDLEGKISVLDFMFTTCRGPCPMMAVEMGKLYQYYQKTPQVQFISISVDPEHDTPAVLNQYAKDHGVVDQRWVFLNGPMEQVKDLCEQGFFLPADELPYGHSIKFILIDRKAQIRGYYESSDNLAMEALKRNLRQLAFESR